MKEKVFLVFAFCVFVSTLFICCTQSAQNKLAMKIAKSKNFIESDSVIAMMRGEFLLKHKNYVKSKARHEMFEFRDSIHRSYMTPETRASVFEKMKISYTDEYKKNEAIFIKAMGNLNKEFPELTKLSAGDRKIVFKEAYRLVREAAKLKKRKDQ